jgi:hypothetical protein
VRPVILIAAALTAAMLLPRAALAFEVNNSTANNPDGSARFSDPDEAPSLPGSLQVFGQTGENTYNGGAYIPQSPPSFRICPLTLCHPGLPLLAVSLIGKSGDRFSAKTCSDQVRALSRFRLMR